jgi:enoyl-CoA hydratase/carnithine racemase
LIIGCGGATFEQKENELDSHKLFDMFNSIYACPMPVIGRINGNAIGGGSGLVSACDFAFSVRSSLSLSLSLLVCGLEARHHARRRVGILN